jgi:putative membrane protein
VSTEPDRTAHGVTAPADASDPYGEWRRVSPAAVIDIVFHMVRQGALQALPALAVLFASAASSDRIELTWAFRGAILLLLVGIAWSVLSYLRFGYRIRGARIDVRKGVLHRETLNVDFDRIQNVSVLEPFYLRPFGIAVVGIDTAGSSGKEIRLPGLTLEDARAVRERLVAHQESAAAADTGASERLTTNPAGTGRILVQLTRKDVIIAGLTANFMLWAFIAIGTVFGAGETSERLVDWLVNTANLREAADAVRAEGGGLLLGAVTAGFAMLALALLPLASVVGALFRYDGYTLTRDGDRFRRTSGMLSKHDDSVRQHKIQGVTWRQNLMARLFGRINLQLRQASAGVSAEQQAGMSGRPAFDVPSLRPAEAERLTSEFLPGSQPGDARITGVDRGRYLLVMSAWPLLILVGPTLSLSIALSPWFGLVWPLGAGITLWVVDRCWRQTGWAVDRDTVLFRKGFIGSRTTLFPLFKVQRVDLVQTPAQRRRGLAHLTLHLASHSVTMPWMNHEDAVRLRDLALYRAESTTEAWF